MGQQEASGSKYLFVKGLVLAGLGDAYLKYSKILSWNAFLSISNRNIPWTQFCNWHKDYSRFSQLLHVPRAVYMQPLENIPSLKLENEANFLLGTLSRGMLQCVPKIR